MIARSLQLRANEVFEEKLVKDKTNFKVNLPYVCIMN